MDQSESEEMEVCQCIFKNKITKMDGARRLGITYMAMRTKFEKFKQSISLHDVTQPHLSTSSNVKSKNEIGDVAFHQFSSSTNKETGSHNDKLVNLHCNIGKSDTSDNVRVGSSNDFAFADVKSEQTETSNLEFSEPKASKGTFSKNTTMEVDVNGRQLVKIKTGQTETKPVKFGDSEVAHVMTKHESSMERRPLSPVRIGEMSPVCMDTPSPTSAAPFSSPSPLSRSPFHGIAIDSDASKVYSDRPPVEKNRRKSKIPVRSNSCRVPTNCFEQGVSGSFQRPRAESADIGRDSTHVAPTPCHEEIPSQSNNNSNPDFDGYEDCDIYEWPALQFDLCNKTHYNHFLCNINTISDLVKKIGEHGLLCDGVMFPFKEYILPKGHKGYSAFKALYKCVTCKKIIEFCPSPVYNNRPISDYLVVHAKYTSGGIWENIERFTETLGFSSDFGASFTNDEFNLHNYAKVIEDLAEVSMENAMKEVVVEDNKLDVSLDASHENRTNSGNSCVTMISAHSLKVLASKTVHRSEESISQNHETVATRKVCQATKSRNLTFRSSSTDEGSKSRQVVADEFPEVIGQLDLYHAKKNDKKHIGKITKGRKCDEGKVWHYQLRDKCDPLIEHIRHAVIESKISVEEFRDPVLLEQAEERLRARILVPLRHYQDMHDKCSPKSRCCVDQGYKLSRCKITDDKALEILENCLSTTIVFKKAKLFLLNIPTSMNECFHNRQNKYFSKRCHLSPEMYSVAINLAVLDHNENEEGVFEDGQRNEPLPLGKEGLPKEPIQTRSFVGDIFSLYLQRLMT